MRIVVIRTSALGDVVLTTPLLRELHAQLGARVEVVTSPAYVSLFQGLPFVGRVWGWERGGEGVAEGILREGPVDVAIDLQNKVRTFRLLRRLRAGRSHRLIKRRGIRDTLSSLVGAGPILDDKPAAAMYFDATAPLGVLPGDLRPSVALDPEAVERARTFLSSTSGKVVALAPGARWELKKWAPGKFAEVGNALAAKGASLLLVGGPDDAEDIEAVRRELAKPPIGDTVKMSVTDLAACLSQADLLVTGDSGPSHLAQGVGTPVVSIFGPTSWRRWGPAHGAGAAVALPLSCSPCSNYGKGGCRRGDRACLDSMPANAAIEVASAALQGDREDGGILAAEAADTLLLTLAQEVSRL